MKEIQKYPYNAIIGEENKIFLSDQVCEQVVKITYRITSKKKETMLSAAVIFGALLLPSEARPIGVPPILPSAPEISRPAPQHGAAGRGWRDRGASKSGPLWRISPIQAQLATRPAAARGASMSAALPDWRFPEVGQFLRLRPAAGTRRLIRFRAQRPKASLREPVLRFGPLHDRVPGAT